MTTPIKCVASCLELDFECNWVSSVPDHMFTFAPRLCEFLRPFYVKTISSALSCHHSHTVITVTAVAMSVSLGVVMRVGVCVSGLSTCLFVRVCMSRRPLTNAGEVEGWNGERSCLVHLFCCFAPQRFTPTRACAILHGRTVWSKALSNQSLLPDSARCSLIASSGTRRVHGCTGGGGLTTQIFDKFWVKRVFPKEFEVQTLKVLRQLLVKALLLKTAKINSLEAHFNILFNHLVLQK